MKTRLTSMLAITVTAAIALVGCSATSNPSNATSTEGVSIPNVSVRFGVEPYPPHTDAIIAIKKGWFKDVGIDLTYKNLQADQVAPLLLSNSVDVASAAPALLIPSMKQGQFDSFVFGDLFQAYAIMGQPDQGYKSYSDFVKAGQSPEKALSSAMDQLKGKIFTYPGEAAIKPFIQLLFDKAGMKLSDTTTEIQPDPNGVALMLSKRADFEIGGLAARITLEQKGYKAIITAADLASAAEASAGSEEIRSIAHVGWSTTKEYADKNHDTLLRLASVKFRIVQYQQDHMDDAIAIHLPLLNKLAGSQLKAADLKTIYEKLDPSFTFDQQKSWFTDKSDPFYWSYELDSIIQSYVDQGIFKKGEFSAKDISSTPLIYQELDNYRLSASKTIASLDKATGKAATLRDQAKKYFAMFDYLDASRFAEAAKKAS